MVDKKKDKGKKKDWISSRRRRYRQRDKGK